MNPKVWIQQIKDKEFFFAFFDVLFLVVSGIPVLFFFERQFFLSTDWIKLVLLSGAISAPFVFVNTIAISSFDDEARLKKRDGLFLSMTMAAMSVALFLDGPLVGIYWTGGTLRNYMVVVALLEVILFVAALVTERRKKKKDKVVAKKKSAKQGIG